MVAAAQAEGGLRIARTELAAPAGLGGELRAFYGERLGLAGTRTGAAVTFTEAAPGVAPFYHLAFLVPSGRFDAALAWARERVEILPLAGREVADFPGWRGRACYFHDPAGSILELIAHDDETPGDPGRPFSPRELLGISEIGLVLEDPAAAAARLDAGLGVPLLQGTVTGPDALGFAGRRAHVLILSAVGRGWLPTDRPAEPHPVTAHLTGAGRTGEVVVGPHRVVSA